MTTSKVRHVLMEVDLPRMIKVKITLNTMERDRATARNRTTEISDKSMVYIVNCTVVKRHLHILQANIVKCDHPNKHNWQRKDTYSWAEGISDHRVAFKESHAISFACTFTKNSKSIADQSCDNALIPDMQVINQTQTSKEKATHQVTKRGAGIEASSLDRSILFK